MTTIHNQMTDTRGDLDNTPPETGGRRSRRAWTVPLAAALVVVLAGSAVAVAGWNTRQDTAHSRATTQWRDAREQLAEHLALAAIILTDAQDTGVDDEALTELQAAITAAGDLDLGIDPALPRSGDITRAREVVAAVDEVRVLLVSATAELRDATTVHRAELGLQALDQATEVIAAALADLEAATAEITEPLTGARERLASSEGRTGNKHDVRVALTQAIDGVTAALAEADALRVQADDTTARLERARGALEEIKASPSIHTEAEGGDGPVYVADAGEELAAAQELGAALAARAAALRESHRGSLSAATSAVAAAEAAAVSTSTGGASSSRATASSTSKATPKSGSTSSGSTGGGSTSGSSEGSTSGSTGGGSTSGSSDGSYWVEESTDGCWVLDTQGGAKPCG